MTYDFGARRHDDVVREINSQSGYVRIIGSDSVMVENGNGEINISLNPSMKSITDTKEFVKSVNGVKPNESGNVKILGSDIIYCYDVSVTRALELLERDTNKITAVGPEKTEIRGEVFLPDKLHVFNGLTSNKKILTTGLEGIDETLELSAEKINLNGNVNVKRLNTSTVASENGVLSLKSNTIRIDGSLYTDNEHIFVNSNILFDKSSGLHGKGKDGNFSKLIEINDESNKIEVGSENLPLKLHHGGTEKNISVKYGEGKEDKIAYLSDIEKYKEPSVKKKEMTDLVIKKKVPASIHEVRAGDEDDRYPDCILQKVKLGKKGKIRNFKFITGYEVKSYLIFTIELLDENHYKIKQTFTYQTEELNTKVTIENPELTVTENDLIGVAAIDDGDEYPNDGPYLRFGTTQNTFRIPRFTDLKNLTDQKPTVEITETFPYREVTWMEYEIVTDGEGGNLEVEGNLTIGGVTIKGKDGDIFIDKNLHVSGGLFIDNITSKEQEIPKELRIGNIVLTEEQLRKMMDFCGIDSSIEDISS